MKAKDLKITNTSDKVVSLSGVLSGKQLQLKANESINIIPSDLYQSYSEVLELFPFVKITEASSKVESKPQPTQATAKIESVEDNGSPSEKSEEDIKPQPAQRKGK